MRRGIRDLVLCPGSRSQPLALAAAALEASGLLRLHVRIDERSAGFLALGLAAESGVPVAVVTTSGTAVANLHPAVLEAAHAGIPLLLLTADRPEELRGIGANQTTVQPGIFAGAAALLDVPAPDSATDPGAMASDVVDFALDGIAGPVHVNLAFRDPLSGSERRPSVAPGTWHPPARAGETLTLRPAPGTVVVAGTGAGPDAERVARELGAPLLAEVASGARFGPALVPAYRRLLGDPAFGGAVSRVVVFGHPTLTREVPAVIAREGVEAIVVSSPGRDAYDPGRRGARQVAAVQVEAGYPETGDGDPRPADVTTGAVDAHALPPADPTALRRELARWVRASRDLLAVEEPSVLSIGDDPQERAAFARAELARLRAPVTRRDLVEAVWAASWPHDRLVLGASRLAREADAVVTGKRLRVHANRGLSGIDGTVATAIGIALASQAPDADGRAGITRLLLGDLAALHDVGSLLFGVGERRPRIQVIVGDDGGGTIFDGLEVAQTADRAVFDRVMLTPQRVDWAALASAYGWAHRRVANRGDLVPALSASAGPTLIEVHLAR